MKTASGTKFLKSIQVSNSTLQKKNLLHQKEFLLRLKNSKKNNRQPLIFRMWNFLPMQKKLQKRANKAT